MLKHSSRRWSAIPEDHSGPMNEGQLKLDEDGLYEVIDGHLVERANVGFQAGVAAVAVIALLQSFAEKTKSGAVAAEVSFCCFPHKPNQIRRPNIVFIAAARLAEVPDEGHVPIVPDLAVEIISPGDLVYELDSKLADYQAAKFPLVWVVNPHGKTVQVYHFGKAKLRLQAGDELTGEEVLPGFAVQVGDLFPVLNRGREV